MSEERKPVICPNCNSAMQCVHDGGIHDGPRHWYQFACDCGVSTPWADTIEAAYLAATRRPPNRPLTREQVERLPRITALYHPYDDCADGSLAIMTAATVCDMPILRFERGLYFAELPTSEDIAAARAGKGAEAQ